jgi:chemotaxis methyl-accepting protein methylase
VAAMAAQKNSVVDIARWRESAGVEMDNLLFQQWTELLAKRTGISLPDSRRSFLVTSLNIRMRELGIESYQAYFNYLLTGHEGNIEWETLVDRLTVHETRFYRDQQAIKLIRDVYLAKLDDKTEKKKSVNVWSVGCATGEETYSLAIDLDDYFSGCDKDYFYAVTGSDISSAAISTAREAIYKENRLGNVPEHFLHHYFDQEKDKSFKVKKFLRKRVCFNQVNLLNLNNARVGLMDVIFCQNVLIYFMREKRIQILNDLVSHLKPDGLLVLGAGEIHGWAHPDMESVAYEGTLAFRRTDRKERKV